MALAHTDHALLAPARAASPTISAALRRVQPAALGVAVVEAVIGYEWLLSALDKFLSPTFRSGLAHQVTMNMQGNPNTWWVALTRTFVLPHAQVWALLVVVGEVLVALGLFAGAVLWMSGHFAHRRWARYLNLGVIGALLGGALMTANYYVMAGNTLPGLKPDDPFDEGLSLDGVLTLIAVGLLVIHVVAVWARTARPNTTEE
jgi:thiosulfate dehydrogenase [quinone] large subunit